jgi:phosphotransferase system enzyme I (PtsI)
MIKDMIELKGVPISHGIAIGKAYLIEPVLFDFSISHIEPPKVKEEIEVLNKAVEKTLSDLEEIYSYSKLSELRMFFENMLANDGMLNRIRYSISNEKLSAKSAIFKEGISVENILKEARINSDKINDILGIFHLLTKNIDFVKGEIKSEKISVKDDIQDYILVGVEIDPTQFLEILGKRNIKGIILEKGGSASHVAIIAHQENIPSVFSVKGLMNNINEDDIVIVDSSKGDVIINPTKEVFSHYRAEKIKIEGYKEQLVEVLKKPTCTIDGERCNLMLNISDPHEVSNLISQHYDGIGLFRTEIPFINQKRFLTEDEQYEMYTTVAEKFAGKPVVIRLLDLGGDKVFGKLVHEDKPALGWRSIRVLFSHEDELLKQLRAIIRSNKYGNVKILIPMVSSLEEINKIKKYYKIAVEDLKSKGISINDNIEIGIMVEVPSVAIMINDFINYVDFISIGTNDLTQYILAVDRNNEIIAEYYEPFNPAVLKVVYHCINVAKKHKKMVSVCGEIAGDPRYTRLFLAMGLRVFSMAKESISSVKNIIINTHTHELKDILNKVKKALTPSEVKRIMEEDYYTFSSRQDIPTY